jgi:hypothetical protein
LNVPATVGVPLIVIVLFAQVALTPLGSPVAVPIPVAPVVVIVMGVNGALMQSVGVADGVAAVLAGVTVIVPVAFTEPHPPVRGMI